MCRHDVEIVNISSRLALSNPTAAVGVPSLHVGGREGLEEPVTKRPAIGGVRGRSLAHDDNIHPLEGGLGVEYGGLNVVLGPTGDRKPQGTGGGCLLCERRDGENSRR